MGDLKPIGSEKLQGMDKINRILEIARYKENIPTPINEDKSLEYSKTLSDGNKYHIVKEKNGYVIKKTINEGLDTEYIEPMKNRKYYSSYSQAFKRLNLIAKEVNLNEGFNENVSLFESDDNPATKYILKFGETKEQQTPKQSTAPTPAPVPSPSPEPSPEPTSGMGDEMSIDEPMPGEEELDMEIDTEKVDDTTEEVSYKIIQKLTGKLAQKIREFSSTDEQGMSSKDIKYVINSILSALDLEKLETEDMEDIMDKLEGSEEESIDMEKTSVEEPEMGLTSDEESIDIPMPDETEMNEDLFNESKVDNILRKYFKLDESEKKKIIEKKETIKTVNNISESLSQKVASRKFLQKNPSAKFLGKTKSDTLVFENRDRKYRITKNGDII